ncbi:MAG: lysophospholipase [Gemmataceae bacterium]
MAYARVFAVVLTLSSLALATIQGDDFGKILRKAVKDKIERGLSPEGIGDALAPGDMDAELYTIKTADGWTLVAHRYRPRGKPLGRPPVILCHGLSYSAIFWDLDPGCSLPTYLSRRGYDVWSVSLRGCGLSQKWVWKLENAPAQALGSALRRLTRGKLAPTGYASLDPKYANWTMDDHILHDVPALVHLVRKQTGASQVAWVGHSMGGIIVLAHLSRYGNPGIGSLITVGSQVTMPDGQLFLQFLGEMTRVRQMQIGGQFDKTQLTEDTRKSIHNMFFNEAHTSEHVYQALTTWATDVPAIGLLRQYTVLATKGELLDSHKDFNYARNLHQITVPILITCGEADQLAPRAVQRYIYQKVQSTDKQLVVFGRSQGFSVNMGHNDTLVGLTSQQQVYPILERWLRAH